MTPTIDQPSVPSVPSVPNASAALFRTTVRARGYGLNLTQLCVLSCIGAHGSIAMAEIGRLVRASAAVMTLNADTLAADHLITRRHDPDDRRSYILTLTEKGRNTLAAIATA